MTYLKICTAVLFIIFFHHSNGQNYDTLMFEDSVTIIFEIDTTTILDDQKKGEAFIESYEYAKLISSSQVASSHYEGKVFVQLLISKKGKPGKVEVIRTFNPDANKIALKKAKKLKFKPTTHSVTGETIPSRIIVPIVFVKKT